MRGADLKLSGGGLYADDGKPLLKDVNPTLPSGWYGLEGASGSGKTDLVESDSRPVPAGTRP